MSTEDTGTNSSPALKVCHEGHFPSCSLHGSSGLAFIVHRLSPVGPADHMISVVFAEAKIWENDQQYIMV